MFRTATFQHFLRGFATNVRDGTKTQDRLRALLRYTAQTVAVVTAKMPSQSVPYIYHGATLSSFTSIAMHPYPLVSFSLRIPSRMSDILRQAQDHDRSHMVVNLLSARQEMTAVKFSRPDLHPDPFSYIPYHHNEDGHPVLDDSLGSLTCRLVAAPIPLHDIDSISAGGRAGTQHASDKDPKSAVSELFIARVLDVEMPDARSLDEGDARTLPLIYYRRRYTSPKSHQ